MLVFCYEVCVVCGFGGFGRCVVFAWGWWFLYGVGLVFVCLATWCEGVVCRCLWWVGCWIGLF